MMTLENLPNLKGFTSAKIKRAKTGLWEFHHENKPNAISNSFKWLVIRQLSGGALPNSQTFNFNSLFTADNGGVGGAQGGNDGIAVSNNSSLTPDTDSSSYLSTITTITNTVNVDLTPADPNNPGPTTESISFRGEIQFASAFDVYRIKLGIGYTASPSYYTIPFDILIAFQSFVAGNNPIEAQANDTLIVDWTIQS